MCNGNALKVMVGGESLHAYCDVPHTVTSVNVGLQSHAYMHAHTDCTLYV